ncbi:transposase [Gemmatimonas sp.]|nr:transposase [Gemmatimonas sp.]
MQKAKFTDAQIDEIPRQVEAGIAVAELPRTHGIKAGGLNR